MNTNKLVMGQQCPCKECRGTMRVETSRINFTLDIRVRHLVCDACGRRGKQVVPLEFAPPKKVRPMGRT